MAFKNKVTSWKTTEKYRPSLPPHILYMLKQSRQIRNRNYRQKKSNTIDAEKTRGSIKVMTKCGRKEINKYKSD